MNVITESTVSDTVGRRSVGNGVATGCKTATSGTLNGFKSNPIEPKGYASKQRDKWLKRLAQEFLMLEGLYPWKDFLPKENSPEWVCRVEEKYLVEMHRGADLKGATKLTPMRLGGFLGYQCAYAVWMVDVLNAAIEDGVKKPEKYKDVVLKKEEYETGLSKLRRWNEWYEALRRLAGRALKSCVYQSYEDMSVFLEAYSRGFSRKPKIGAGLGDFGSSNFGIYHFMLWNWRGIERLDSVRALHDLLRRSMGEYRVGDLKRIEKTCQRVGLHFRKPGRPKASK